jgi:hypothetical protein
MDQPPGRTWAARKPAGPTRPPDLVSPLLTVALPKGRMDLHLRLTCYADGSRALELRDSEGVPFYSPTLPCCLTTMASLLAPEEDETRVVAIKPSALRNGMANALLDAALLEDLGIEMPVDRHWVRLMRVAPACFDLPADSGDKPASTPLALKPLAVPPGWDATCRRIQSAFRRHGLVVSASDARLAWAEASRAIARVPAPLPPSSLDIVEQLQPLFRSDGEAAVQLERFPGKVEGAGHQHP